MHVLSQLCESIALGKELVCYVSAAPECKLLISEDSARTLVQKWIDNNWEDFDDYASWVNKLRLVIINPDKKGNWNGCTCHCKTFQKKHLCEDVVAVAHLEGRYRIPTEFRVSLMHSYGTCLLALTFTMTCLTLLPPCYHYHYSVLV